MEGEVRRKHFYIRRDARSLFAWSHSPVDVVKIRPCTVILCPPIGYEYMSVHRTYRHLAATLAQAGFRVIRFDYHNTGDSSGARPEALSIESCVDDLVCVCDFVREDLNCQSICGIGFGYGGTVAALASERAGIDKLVLWEPRINGRRYIRELNALAAMSPDSQDAPAEFAEAAGVYLTQKFCEDLHSLDLTEGNYTSLTHCLVLNSKTSQGIRKLAAKMESEAVECILETYLGYEGIVAYPTETVVPESAIEQQVQWLRACVATGETSLSSDDVPTHGENVLVEGEVEERGVILRDTGIFGILGQPHARISADGSRHCVLFINCGSEHHAGPHRMYTNFCRTLSAAGLVCMRIDIEGIGDSPARGGNADNYAYSPCATRDIASALAFLRDEYKEPIFTLVGICGGAFHGFRAAAELKTGDIAGCIMINPLVYHWKQGDEDRIRSELATVAEYCRYKSELLRLSRGEHSLSSLESLKRFMAVLMRCIKYFAGSRFNKLGAEYNDVVRERLLDIVKKGTRVLVVVADGDPGLVALRNRISVLYDREVKSGRLVAKTIRNADHGFSKRNMRERLFFEVACFLEALRK